MEENYGVYWGNKLAGKVQVLRQGLYYRFICRCQLPENLICRLYVSCDDRKESLGILVPVDEGFGLGILVPVDEGFGLDTRIPVKKIGLGEMTFSLAPKHSTTEKFVPIYPEEPFAYIENLKDGFLTIQDGKKGIMIETGHA